MYSVRLCVCVCVCVCVYLSRYQPDSLWLVRPVAQLLFSASLTGRFLGLRKCKLFFSFTSPRSIYLAPNTAFYAISRRFVWESCSNYQSFINEQHLKKLVWAFQPHQNEHLTWRHPSWSPPGDHLVVKNTNKSREIDKCLNGAMKNSSEIDAYLDIL